jgi:hypothetical protein
MKGTSGCRHLVLDLAFARHRYIRRNVAHDRLVEWAKHKQR